MAELFRDFVEEAGNGEYAVHKIVNDGKRTLNASHSRIWIVIHLLVVVFTMIYNNSAYEGRQRK